MATTLDASQSKRLVGALLGVSLWVLALDAWVSHYAGKVEGHPTQILPIIVGAGGGLLLMLACALPRASSFRAGMLVFVGLLSAGLGLGGAWFHMGSFLQTMGSDAWTSDNVQGALSVSPPPFVPLAFVGLGAVMVLLGVNRVLFTVRLRKGAGSPVTKASKPSPRSSVKGKPEPVTERSRRRAVGR